MDPEIKFKWNQRFNEAKTEVQRLIAKARQDNLNTCRVYVQNKILKAGKVEVAPCETYIVAKLTNEDIQIGLTTKKWQQIDAFLRVFVERGIL